MRIKPIPRRLLPDKVTITHGRDDPNSFENTKSVKHKLEHVRIQQTDKALMANIGDNSKSYQQLSSSILFIDAVNSDNPDGYQPVNGDEVLYNGRNFSVIQVEPVKNDQVLHHWEAYLE
ncbi:putative minor capsid protein [Latilactobacillus sakei]|uniref:putative minor capsid protein n=1 Tax=Latilactobacillus sakei TaxID=1599 RepID=UPI0020C82CBA|nr:putative minor capsid protein [Latilactobacillus sakei]MCP8851487.1 putative minor capsid protein [Latilactobacillus sakei]